MAALDSRPRQEYEHLREKWELLRLPLLPVQALQQQVLVLLVRLVELLVHEQMQQLV